MNVLMLAASIGLLRQRARNQPAICDQAMMRGIQVNATWARQKALSEETASANLSGLLPRTFGKGINVAWLDAKR